MAPKYTSKFSKVLDGDLVDDTYLGTDKYDRVNTRRERAFSIQITWAIDLFFFYALDKVRRIQVSLQQVSQVMLEQDFHLAVCLRRDSGSSGFGI
jgi:hypothetical protein